MLLQFTLGNFKSFKDKAILSLEATGDDAWEDDNISHVEAPALRLLKAAAIFGPNAGGKSNLIEAMVRFRTFVLESSKDSQKGQAIPVVPFRLSSETEAGPSFFEAVFLLDGIRYRYGFEAAAFSVRAEWLFQQGRSIRETCLFTREGDVIRPRPTFSEGRGLEEKTRSNALFLSVVAQFNGTISGEVMRWMEQFRPISGLEEAGYRNLTTRLLSDLGYGASIRELVRQSDVGIEDVFRQDTDAEEFIGRFPAESAEAVRGLIASDPEWLSTVISIHKHFDSSNRQDGTVPFTSQTEWSAGTRQLFALAGPFLRCLHEGSVLVVDELNARLHPLLTRKLVGLFNSSANNRGAQLIFATHDAGLLDEKSMRRDQIWFVEKNDVGASELFCLAEIKGVRKDANFEREYLLGQFGGVPRVGDLQAAVADGES